MRNSWRKRKKKNWMEKEKDEEEENREMKRKERRKIKGEYKHEKEAYKRLIQKKQVGYSNLYTSKREVTPK